MGEKQTGGGRPLAAETFENITKILMQSGYRNSCRKRIRLTCHHGCFRVSRSPALPDVGDHPEIAAGLNNH
jgi:hypothetical protein